jgi:hypothetical protein
MATLVLTAAGSLLGPIGGAVGALAGQAIDGQIFKPKGRQGPRLQDLKVQTSSYGAAIPKLFGTLRVAGTVIWATDLVEHRSKQGGGKGRPSTTTYSYSASFAVLLSGRAIRSVGRIWADGNLLRGTAGDWKSETGFRLHLGGEDQAADPFIASAEGAGGTPAYRGGAYAVFENMALGPFGNRIPSLTFEVDADAGPVPVGAMLGELSMGTIGGAGVSLRGFAASGDSVASLVETLGAALPIVLNDDGVALRIGAGGAPLMLTASEMAEDGSEAFAAAADVPETLRLSYYEPARDYQAGVQQALRPGRRRAIDLELPAALAADEARAVAEDALARLARERGRREVRVGWARMTAGPGRDVRLPGDPGGWRVAERSVDRAGVRLKLGRVWTGGAMVPPAEPGRGVSAPDEVHGPTVVHAFDLPGLDDAAIDVPRLYVAAAGPSPGWRRAALLASLDSGVSWTSIGGTAAPALIGTATTGLGEAGEALIDTEHAVEIVLLHDRMLLEDADDARLLAGANLALLGDELIQFGRAEPLEDARWRLSRLTRGRRGTGAAAGAHAAGDRFVLIEAEALAAYDPPLSAAGGTVTVMASGIGDADPATASVPAIGAALRPPAPVHLAARHRSDGRFDISWIRSSRAGWAWLDGTDAPLAEDREAYRLTIAPDVGPSRTQELSVSAFVYDPAEDPVAGEVTLSVVQVGTRAVSAPAALTLSL